MAFSYRPPEFLLTSFLEQVFYSLRFGSRILLECLGKHVCRSLHLPKQQLQFLAGQPLDFGIDYKFVCFA